jgi:MFS family permease
VTEFSNQSDDSPKSARPSSLRSFKHRNYRLFYTSSIISNIGTWVQRVAQDWLVLQLTHSGTALGIVTGLQFLPVLFLSLHGGALADRVDKRLVLIITNIGGGLSALTLGLLVVNHNVQIWHVYVLAISLGIFAAVDAPVRQSFAVEMVGREDLPNAVSLNSANFNGARLIGPALSGLMINAFGTGPSFILNGISFIGVIFALMAIRTEDLYRKPKVSKSDQSVREGLRYVRSRPDLLAVIVMVGIMSICGLNFQITLALMAKNEFGRGAGAFGILGSCVAIGSLSGAILSVRLGRKPTLKFVMVGALVFGTITFIAGLMPTYETFAMILPLCGFAAITTIIAASSIIQTGSTTEVHGRIVGIYMLVYVGGTPIGSPVIGWIGQVAGPRWSLLIGGGVIAVAALLIGGLNSRRLPRSGRAGSTSDDEFDGQDHGLGNSG